MFERLIASNVRAVSGAVQKIGKFTLVSGAVGGGKTTIAELLYYSAVASSVRANFICDGPLPSAAGAMDALLPAGRDFLGRDPVAFLRERQGLAPMWFENPVGEHRTGVVLVDLASLFGETTAPWASFRLARHHPGGFSGDDIERITALAFVNPPALDASMIPAFYAHVSPLINVPRLLQTDDQSKTPVLFFYSWDPAFCDPRRKPNEELAERIAAWATVGKPPSHYATAFIDASWKRLPRFFEQRAKERFEDWNRRIRRAAMNILGNGSAVDDALRNRSTGERYVIDVVSAFEAMSALSGDDQGLIVIEKPEGRLDPATLVRLLKYIALVIRNFPIQVVVETSSLEAVAAFTKMLLSGEIKPEDGIFLRTLIDEKTRKISASWFDVRNLETWLENGHDPRFARDDDADVIQNVLRFRLKNRRNGCEND